ncbi:MAG: undecaprenyl-phosphate 4-deoxy-4-formamido-L-arabinose transferase, partial [Arsenophonus sp. NC-QC1-MAG3]
KYSLMKLINLMFDLLTCLTTTQLRLLSIIGSFIAASGFLLTVLLIILRLIFGVMWALEGVFTLLAILFIFIGTQFIAMGLLGKYIGRMYNDVCVRPCYFIQKIIGVHQDTDKSQGEK